MPDEAPLVRVGSGLVPQGDGWFVLNVHDAAWISHDTFGVRCIFEANGPSVRGHDATEHPFAQLGFQVAVLQPGQPSTLYHAEERQEDFLVVAGGCTLVVEGEVRELRPWDFVHCPPGTLHAFRAGDEPCVLVCAGARTAGVTRYVPTPLAESVEAETASGAEAYAPYGHWRNDAARRPAALPGNAP